MKLADFIKDSEDIFLDKLKVSWTVFGFELRVIQEYESLLRRLIIGEITEEDLQSDGDFYVVWQLVIQLYRIFEFNDKIIGKILTKNEHQRLISIIDRYRTADRKLSIQDLAFAYDNVRKIVHKSGFHDVSIRGDYDEDDF